MGGNPCLINGRKRLGGIFALAGNYQWSYAKITTSKAANAKSNINNSKFTAKNLH
jgi:hypothetical protein